MKKILLALVILLVANLSCKKQGGGGLCACSPLVPPYLSLVIKNATGEDLLSDKTIGFYSKGDIQLYYIDATDFNRQIAFHIRQPFSYGDNKFIYNQLYTAEIVALAKAGVQTFYLKLGNEAPQELTMEISQPNVKVEKVLIDKKEAIRETGRLQNYSGGNIFYFVK